MGHRPRASMMASVCVQETTPCCLRCVTQLKRVTSDSVSSSGSSVSKYQCSLSAACFKRTRPTFDSERPLRVPTM
uniref:Uncharacterized protein n=1 Tax=Hyaloperonospora arabidopsidis (strain Emoy2) TaxID=559515 RepID=M4BXX3_HYAAE